MKFMCVSILVAAAGLLVSGCVHHTQGLAISTQLAAKPQADMVRVAVLPFESSNPYVLGGVIADHFAEALFKENLPIDLVERQKMAKILEEQKLNLLGMTRQDSVFEAASLLGVDYLLIGSISTLETIQGHSGSIAVTVKLLEVSTGRITWMKRDKISECSWRWKEVTETSENLMAKAARQMIDYLKNDLKDSPILAKKIQHLAYAENKFFKN